MSQFQRSEKIESSNLNESKRDGLDSVSKNMPINIKFEDSSEKLMFDQKSCSKKNENIPPCLEGSGIPLSCSKPASDVSRRSQGARISKVPWLEDDKESLKQFNEVENILNSFYDSNLSESKQFSEPEPPLPKPIDAKEISYPEDKIGSIGQPIEKMEASDGKTSRTSASSDTYPDKMMQELDNMINENSIYSTQTPLNLLGSSSVKEKATANRISFNPLDGPPFRCVGCSQIIDDELCRTENSVWHPVHFNCAVCSKSLIDEDFFEIDYELYCHIDYELKFLQKCAVCNEFIYDELITVSGRYYHSEHFSCSSCAKPLANSVYYEHGNTVYCETCFSEKYAPHCKGCDKPVTADFLKTQGSIWHASCFCCKICGTPFKGGLFHLYENSAYCELHYHEARGTLCFSCNQPIIGVFSTAENRKFHPDHFCCSYCKKKLSGASYKEFNGKPFCVNCCANLGSNI